MPLYPHTKTPLRTKIMNALLDQFLNHTIASTSIPYCQIISPPNLKSADLDKWVKNGGLSQIGFFVKAVEAEKAGFIPDESWQPYEASLGDGTEIGFVCNKPKFVIIHKSQQEVQYRTSKDDKYTFLDLAWNNGEKTAAKKAADADKDLYKTVTRHLVLFLGKDDRPLHTTPLQYTAKGAFAASLYAETGELYKQVSKVYFQALKNAGKQASGGMLSPFALAFVKVDIEIGFSRNKPTESPFCVPSKMAFPTLDNVGKDLEVARPKGERKIVLQGVPLEDVMLSMASDAGKLIASWHSEYKSFPKPRRELQKFEGRAIFSDVFLMENGDISAKMQDGKKCHIPKHLAHIAMGGEWEISGLIDNGVILVREAEIFDDGYSPRNVPPHGYESDNDSDSDEFPPY